jgi:hypothetical protein
MAKDQLSIRIESATRGFLERYGKVDDAKNDITLSGQLREDMQTFQEIVTAAERSLAGKFETGEAMLIVDVLNSYYFTPGGYPSLPFTLEAEVDDACRLDGLDTKWEIDREALVKKIKKLKPMQAYAVFHMARLVWAKHDEGDFEELVKRIFRCK